MIIAILKYQNLLFKTIAYETTPYRPNPRGAIPNPPAACIGVCADFRVLGFCFGDRLPPLIVILAQAGIQEASIGHWTPACAGVTGSASYGVIPGHQDILTHTDNSHVTRFHGGLFPHYHGE